MAESTARCPACAAPLEPRRGPGLQGRAGTVAAQVEAAPVLACPDGHHAVADRHRRRALARGAAAAIGVAGRGRRRVRGTGPQRCSACAADLTIPGRRTTRTTSTDVPPIGIVRVTFDVPMLRCPECVVESLPYEAAGDLEAAVLAAFEGG